jgi:hypothetical protein
MRHLTIPKILVGLLFTACTGSAGTLYLYQFSYEATSGPIQSFSASFVSPDLLTGSGAAFTVNPFTITDGNNTWVMVQGIATGEKTGGECLNFGTVSNVLSDCELPVFSDHDGGLLVIFGDSLPTQPGTFTPDEVFGGFTIGPESAEGFDVPGDGSFNFEITQVDVPEPTSLHLIVVGLALISWRLRRARRSSTTSSR